MGLTASILHHFIELLKKRELIKEYIPGKFAELGSKKRGTLEPQET